MARESIKSLEDVGRGLERIIADQKASSASKVHALRTVKEILEDRGSHDIERLSDDDLEIAFEDVVVKELGAYFSRQDSVEMAELRERVDVLTEQLKYVAAG
jgi:uncharacterized coiled-coil protein SlyX